MHHFAAVKSNDQINCDYFIQIIEDAQIKYRIKYRFDKREIVQFASRSIMAAK